MAPNSKCVYRNFYSEGNAGLRPSFGRDREFSGDAAPLDQHIRIPKIFNFSDI